MTLPLSVSDPGMQAVLTAFQDADQTAKAVRSGVSGAAGAMQWSGDASTAYRNAVAAWLDGLSRVEAGLHAMDEAMRAHQQRTTTAEDSATTDSSSWYRQ